MGKRYEGYKEGFKEGFREGLKEKTGKEIGAELREELEAEVRKELREELVDEVKEELKADYVQAAHHGQNLETDIYDMIGAGTVFVDAPEYLRQEDHSTHTAYEHMEYFKDKMKILTYDTTPNTIVLH